MIALSSQVVAMNIAATTASAMRRRKRPNVMGLVGWLAFLAGLVVLGAWQ